MRVPNPPIRRFGTLFKKRNVIIDITAIITHRIAN